MSGYKYELVAVVAVVATSVVYFKALVATSGYQYELVAAVAVVATSPVISKFW